jgi:hypothetical protein
VDRSLITWIIIISRSMFHLFWYICAVPFLGMFAFIFVFYTLDAGFFSLNTIVSAFTGSLFAIFFTFVVGSLVAVLLLPIVIVSNNTIAFVVHLIGVPAHAWFSVPWGDQMAKDNWLLVFAVIATLSILTALVYRVVWRVFDHVGYRIGVTTGAKSDDSDDRVS